MKRTAQDAERERKRHVQYGMLAAHYRAIGPAALLAALICAPNSKAAPVLAVSR
jgi:hypothetical protein